MKKRILRLFEKHCECSGDKFIIDREQAIALYKKIATRKALLELVDDNPVHAFAGMMQSKLTDQHANATEAQVSDTLKRCIEKGDLVDVANLCMLLTMREKSPDTIDPVSLGKG